MVTKCQGENYSIKNDKIVKVIEYDSNNEVEIQDVFCENRSNAFESFIKLGKHMYLNKKNNKIETYNINSEKSEECLRRSMKQLRMTLKNNFRGYENELFVTLTTERDVKDIKEMKSKYKQWWIKMKQMYEDLEYVAVYEKHKLRNSWHIHLLLKASKHKYLYIANREIEKIWKLGYTKTSRVISCNNNNEVREDYKLMYKDKIVENLGIDKVISYMCKIETKGEIPPFERCYSCSREIRKPTVTKMTYDETKKKMNGSYKLKSQYTALVRNENTNAILNKIKIENWKRK